MLPSLALSLVMVRSLAFAIQILTPSKQIAEGLSPTGYSIPVVFASYQRSNAIRNGFIGVPVHLEDPVGPENPARLKGPVGPGGLARPGAPARPEDLVRLEGPVGLAVRLEHCNPLEI